MYSCFEQAWQRTLNSSPGIVAPCVRCPLPARHGWIGLHRCPTLFPHPLPHLPHSLPPHLATLRCRPAPDPLSLPRLSTMNTASRMESTAPKGCIQVSEATYDLLGRPDGLFKSMGAIEVKGKGGPAALPGPVEDVGCAHKLFSPCYSWGPQQNPPKTIHCHIHWGT